VNADIACILLATAFAADKHRNQRRKDEEASPYINHPVALANLLAQAGVGDTTVLAAALLHDTIEDTDATVEELMGTFGEKITTVVLEVTDDKSLPKAERKREYFDWARQVVDGLRGIHARLEELFDAEYAKRP
jgi:guanosine-3',5'-bis(diphosphate) 3'-pyrophosphohydrolase